ncbi:PKD domain-containing protein [Thalassotalea psychrophila]|uniref:PKD domain-containing protein n=1 Tax=Thalassotalea psychrophila TaxID=3065647 RepID=A0ABY9TWC5_9GAMM|nr:PKD domain-containing protein [Colwelliaceae bacterium SQ149]
MFKNLILVLVVLFLFGCGGSSGSKSSTTNQTQTIDTDSDGTPDNIDTDDDNDGVEDAEDAFPLDSTETVDTDNDGIGNNADTDDDNDGVPDTEDDFPLDNTRSSINTPPVANFTNEQNKQLVIFTDTSTDDGSIASWSWDFGDETTSDQQNPMHQYINGGSYNVCLTVTDSEQSSIKHCLDIMVNYLLSITPIIVTKCGAEIFADDAQLIVHNANFSTKTKVQINEQGLIEYYTAQTHADISILFSEGDDPNASKLIAKTFMNQPMTDMKILYHQSDTTQGCVCELTNFSVKVPDMASDMINTGFIMLTGFIQGDGPSFLGILGGETLMTDYEICRDENENWPAVSATASFSVNDQAYATYIADYVPNQDLILDKPGTAFSITINDENLNVLKVATGDIEGNQQLRQLIVPWPSIDMTSDVFYFPDLTTSFYKIETLSIEHQAIIGMTNPMIQRYSRQFTDQPQNTIDIKLPLESAQDLLDFVQSDNLDYDFRSYASIDVFWFNIKMSTVQDKLIDWNIYAPVTGKVPNQDNFDVFDFISVKEFELLDNFQYQLNLTSFNDLNGYQEFLEAEPDRFKANLFNSTWQNTSSISFTWQE